MANYIKLELNKPVTVALKYPTPKEVSGGWGPQLLWILADGRSLYTAVEYRDAISKFKPGQRFTVTKRKIGNATVLDIHKCEVSGPAELHKSVVSPQPAIRVLERSDSLDSPVTEVPRTRLAASLWEAVDAAAQAEKHVQKIGYQLRFQPGDIRAMAISVLIDFQRRAA